MKRDYNGKNNPSYKHGLVKHSLYWIFNSIKDRCYNKNNRSYKNYGGRGITVCDEWRKDVIVFYNWAIANGWKKGLQIDRINNNGNYEPNNCRFISHRINQSNKRNTSKYGVGIYKNGKGFMVRINVSGKLQYKGTYKTIKEAEKFCILLLEQENDNE